MLRQEEFEMFREWMGGAPVCNWSNGDIEKSVNEWEKSIEISERSSTKKDSEKKERPTELKTRKWTTTSRNQRRRVYIKRSFNSQWFAVSADRDHSTEPNNAHNCHGYLDLRSRTPRIEIDVSLIQVDIDDSWQQKMQNARWHDNYHKKISGGLKGMSIGWEMRDGK